jgi:ATP synthase protein I
MKDEYKAVGSWGTLGLEIVLSVMVGFFGGRWIDERLGTSPWLSLLGFVAGCGAAGKAIHRTWREMQAVTAREEREEGNPAPLYEKPEDREPREEEGSRDQPSAPMSSPEEQDDERAR